MFKSIFIIGAMIGAMTLNAQGAQAELKAIGDNVYMHFSQYRNSLVVVGGNGVLVVDPSNTALAKTMKAEIEKVTDKKVSHVVLSHEHYDHVGGSEVFKGAEIVCHSTCQRIFDLDVLGIAPKKVTKSFDDKLLIDLGGKVVELSYMGTGDGIATTIIRVPSDKVVATADLYGPKSLTPGKWLDDKNYLGTRKILNALSQWDIKHALSGHSPSTDPAALRENAAFLNDLYTAVKSELDRAIENGGIGAAFKLLDGELQSKVKLPKYKDWRGYNKHLPRHVWRMAMSILHGG